MKEVTFKLNVGDIVFDPFKKKGVITALIFDGINNKCSVFYENNHQLNSVTTVIWPEDILKPEKVEPVIKTKILEVTLPPAGSILHKSPSGELLFLGPNGWDQMIGKEIFIKFPEIDERLQCTLLEIIEKGDNKTKPAILKIESGYTNGSVKKGNSGSLGY